MYTGAMERIAFIGTGIMGRQMARHLVLAGYNVTVHTRTPEKASELIAAGAHWADSPAEAFSGAELLISMLGGSDDVEAFWLGPSGCLESAPRDCIIADMTTSSVYSARRLAVEAARLSIPVLDAPVSGGERGAREAALNIMAGGPDDAFERCRPVFEVFGKTVTHLGEAGSGQLCALANHIMAAANLVGCAEALMFIIRAGMDPSDFLSATLAGASASWVLSNHFRDMIDGNIAPGLAAKHLKRELSIAVSEARELGLKLPGLELAFRLYSAFSALGYRELQYADEMVHRVGSGEKLARLDFPEGLDQGSELGVHALYLLYAAGRV